MAVLALRRARATARVLHSALLAAQPGAPEGPETAGHLEVEYPTAAVEIDGDTLFRVRGVTALPAEVRVAGIARRIIALARDPDFRPEMLKAEEGPTRTNIVAGIRPVMSVTDADA